MNIWFTSDTHYGHANIAGPEVSRWSSGYRDFRTLQEMNEALVNGINKYVKIGDILYHLGDWSFGGIHNIYYFRQRLMCENIHIILGNHDKHIVDKVVTFKESSFNPIDLFASATDQYGSKLVRYGKIPFYLSHYSHRTWPGSNKGSIHLYGHSHNSLPGLGKSMDVGVESAIEHYGEYRPFHVNDILEIMKNKELMIHHEKRTEK